MKWTEPYCGVTHLQGLPKGWQASVEDYGRFVNAYVLFQSFTPIAEMRGDDLTKAKHWAERKIKKYVRERGEVMWVFTKYGFFSIACNTKGAKIDKENVVVRARVKAHLQNLKRRFDLRNKIVELDDRDYAYRILMPKKKWAHILAEMAEEQEWTNFKNEAAKNQATLGSEYVNKLHEVWGVMHELQYPRVRRSGFGWGVDYADGPDRGIRSYINHRNCDATDNRRENLEVVDEELNMPSDDWFRNLG